MFSIHRWTKERVKRETERVIWSSSGHWGWRRSELEARTFLFGSTLRWLQWSVHEITVLIIFHQVRECWIIAYNTSPNINIELLINFSRVTTVCFQQSIFVVSVGCRRWHLPTALMTRWPTTDSGGTLRAMVNHSTIIMSAHGIHHSIISQRYTSVPH